MFSIDEEKERGGSYRCPTSQKNARRNGPSGAVVTLARTADANWLAPPREMRLGNKDTRNAYLSPPGEKERGGRRETVHRGCISRVAQVNECGATRPCSIQERGCATVPSDRDLRRCAHLSGALVESTSVTRDLYVAITSRAAASLPA